MAMIWRPPGRARERVLAYGPQGAGKTYAAMQMVAKALGPGERAYVVDIDNAWGRMLETDGVEMGLAVVEEYQQGVRDREYEVEDGNVVLYHCRGWEASVKAIADALKRAGRNDWLVVDSMSWLWDDVLAWYIERTHGSELPEFLISARIEQVKAGKTTAAKGATGGQEATVVEWNYINPVWNKQVATPLVNAQCHVYLCSEAKEARTDGRQDKQLSVLYEQIGWLPKTQKRVGNGAQTILFFNVSKTGAYKVTTVKDRGRDKMEEVEWSDLGSTYLRQTAGWKPRKVTDDE